MANGNGADLSSQWAGLPDDTKIRLTIGELDRLHSRINRLSAEMTHDITEARADFTQRINDLRTEMRAAFAEMEAKQSRITGLLLTILGGVVVGLVLLVAQVSGG